MGILGSNITTEITPTLDDGCNFSVLEAPLHSASPLKIGADLFVSVDLGRKSHTGTGTAKRNQSTSKIKDQR